MQICFFEKFAKVGGGKDAEERGRQGCLGPYGRGPTRSLVPFLRRSSTVVEAGGSVGAKCLLRLNGGWACAR